MRQDKLFPLTDEQLEGLQRELKNAVLERQRILLQKKAANDEFKEQLDVVESRMKDLAHLLDDNDREAGRKSFFDGIAEALVDPDNVESMRPKGDDAPESVSIETSAGKVTLHKDGRTERRSRRGAAKRARATV